MFFSLYIPIAVFIIAPIKLAERYSDIKRLGLYLPTSILLPSKADLTDRLDTIFSSLINTAQQSHISVPVALLGEHHLLLEMLTVLLHNLQICICKSLTCYNCTHSAQTRRTSSSKPNLCTFEGIISRRSSFTDKIGCHHSLTSHRTWAASSPKWRGNHEFRRTWFCRVLTTYSHRLHNYKQILRKLKFVCNASQSKQWHTVRTV